MHGENKIIREDTHLLDLNTDRMIILKWILEIGCEYLDWIEAIQDNVQWKDFENSDESNSC